MYPISDLTAFCRRTTGDVPPKLVGASTTVVGSKMYLYGGRLVSERRMVSDIYMFDLETFDWERLVQHYEDDIPQARYFHSADTWKNHLIIFGGMAIKPQSDNPEDLCVLNDVRLYDLTTGHWLPSSSTAGDSSPSSFIPNARYAHLSSVTADRLFVIGGQDLANVWLDDVYIYDLTAKIWVQRRDYSRHCGTYRSVAVTGDVRVRLPQEELRNGQPTSSKIGARGMRFKVDRSATPTMGVTQSESLVHLPYSAPPTDDYPCDIFLFSNYNFTDVQRELEVFTPLSDSDFTISDRSASMTGTSFPPGLRFPTGAILGTFFIVAGTYLSQTYQSFSIWALDLINMTWSRIDPGSALATGSWFRSCLWPAANKFLVFGNRHGNLVEDYNRRLLSWDHVTCIDLEAFGIYQPPPLVLEPHLQELGLAALEEGILTDFEIVCDDGRKVKCSRKLLEDRWPWFKEQRRLYLQTATRAIAMMPTTSQHVSLPDLPGAPSQQEPRPDPRLTPRAFLLSEPYPITLALVQYLYSTALITPLQHAPAVLSQLLLIATNYGLTHLQSLVKHAMHRALSYATSVGIYGVSTLCSCRSLQIRALRVVMAYSQKRPAGGRVRSDRDGPPGARYPDSSNGGGSSRHGHGGSPSEGSSAARPRGMSDASYLRGTSENGSTSSNQGYSNGMLRATAADASETASLVTLRPRAMSETLYPRRDHFGSLDSDVLELTPACPEGTRLTTPATWQSPDLAYSERPFSVVSLSTDQELRDIAEMMSTPDPDDRGADSEDDTPHTPTPEVPGALSDDLVMGMFEQRPDDSYSATYSRSRSNSASSVLTPPSHTDSEGDYFSDDFCDSAVLSPSKENFPAYHLPRSPSAHWDSDTPSLSSSASYISLSTPSLSRKSSFHPSPPVSPTSATSLITPVDAFALPPLPPKHLGVIEEAQTPEDDDAEARWSRRRLQGLLAAEASPATISRPPSPVRPRSKSHSGAVFSRLFSASALNLSLSKAEEKKKKKEAAKEQRRSADAVKPRKYAEPAVFLENSMLSGDPFSPMP